MSGEFDDEEWARLEHFAACAHRLVECRIVETQSQVRFGFKGSAGEPMQFSAGLPPEGDIAEFLHRMRPFVLEKDPTSFFRVRNILSRHITLPDVRAYLDDIKSLYQGEAVQIVFGIGGAELSSEEALDQWLNAFEYHQDFDKKSVLQSVYRIFPEPAARAMFVMAMLRRASAVGRLARLVDRLVTSDTEPKPLIA